jgi:hypothetical protein
MFSHAQTEKVVDVSSYAATINVRQHATPSRNDVDRSDAFHQANVNRSMTFRVVESDKKVLRSRALEITPIDDGSSNAPECTIQLPSLLAGYRVRPNWRVAGVDYCVGRSERTPLKDPATISMSGVSVDAAGRRINVTGDKVRLDGYDFSLHGGWSVVIKGNDTEIINSYLLVGSNHLPPIVGTVSSTNLYVGYCVIDGNNDRNTTPGALISMSGSSLKVEYSWLKNSGEDMIQIGGGGNLVVHNNLFQEGGQGFASGAHGDFLQVLFGPYINVSIMYNTTVQTTGWTQGMMVEPDVGQIPGKVETGKFAHNTMVTKRPNNNNYAQNYLMGVTVDSLVSTYTVHDNYYDASGALSFAAGGTRGGPNDSSPKTIFMNNVNMATGAILQDSTVRLKAPRH